MSYIEIVKRISQELDIPYEVVNFAYRSYWEFIRNTIKNLDLNSINTEEEFNKLRTNFNVPSLGKLVCTYDKFCSIRRRKDYLKKLKEYVEIKEN